MALLFLLPLATAFAEEFVPSEQDADLQARGTVVEGQLSDSAPASADASRAAPEGTAVPPEDFTDSEYGKLQLNSNVIDTNAYYVPPDRGGEAPAGTTEPPAVPQGD